MRRRVLLRLLPSRCLCLLLLLLGLALRVTAQLNSTHPTSSHNSTKSTNSSTASTAAASDMSVDATAALLLAQLQGNPAPGLGSTVTSSPSVSSTAISSESRALAQSIASQLIVQRNSSGKLPPMEQINQYMIDEHGDDAFTFMTAQAGAATAGAAASTTAAVGGGGAGLGSLADTSIFSGGPTGLPQLGQPFNFGNNPLASPTRVMSVMFQQPAAFDDVLDHALRRVRYGVYQTLFGWLNFAGGQLIAVGDFLFAADAFAEGQLAGLAGVAFILLAVGAELSAFGFAAIGFQGNEQITEALIDLDLLMQKRQRERERAAMGATSATGGAGGGSSASGDTPVGSSDMGTNLPVWLPPGQPTLSVLGFGGIDQTTRPDAINAAGTALTSTFGSSYDGTLREQRQQYTGTPATGAMGAPSLSWVEELVNEVRGGVFSTAAEGTYTGGTTTSLAAAAPMVCPSILYGSWLRLELLGSGEAAPASSLLMHFSINAIERVETTLSGKVVGQEKARKRVRHQRWLGSLHVDCEWAGQDEATASKVTAAAAAAKSSADLTNPAQQSRLLEALWEALSMPRTAPVDITVGLDVAEGAAHGSSSAGSAAWPKDAPPLLHFLFTPIRLQGTLHATLVEQLRQPNGSIKHGRAFVRVD